MALWAHSTSCFRQPSLRSSPSFIRCAPGIGRLIRLRKFRGQLPDGPTGDGETQVVSVKCLMSSSGHLLRPIGIGDPFFSFTRFIVVQCVLKKNKCLTPAHSSNLPGHHIEPNFVDPRHTMIPSNASRLE